MIVFVVTSRAFPQRDVKVTSEQSRAWVSSGLNKLPEEIGNQEYSVAHSCTALIYEFKQTGNGAELIDPSQIPGKTHLVYRIELPLALSLAAADLVVCLGRVRIC